MDAHNAYRQFFLISIYMTLSKLFFFFGGGGGRRAGNFFKCRGDPELSIWIPTVSLSDNTPGIQVSHRNRIQAFVIWVLFRWLTHNDRGDSEQHKSIPKQVTFNILLGDVLDFLLGQKCALADSLLESLHPAPHPGLFSVAFCHVLSF